MKQQSYWESPIINYLVILIVWLFATSFNLFKPIHIDDAAHLEIAEWIADKPLKPLSGSINWENTSVPIYKGNQPALYFYALAAIGSLTGFNPIVLHFFQSLILLFLLILIYKTTKLFSPENCIISIVLIGCNPGIVINQNLMVDIPLLTLWIAAFYFLSKPNITVKNHLISGIFIGFSLLTKYTSLPILIIYFIIVVIRFNFKKWWLILIPTSFLAAWSVFNYLDYGGIHIFEREAKGFHLIGLYDNFLSSLVTLGAISFFSPLLLLINSKKTNQKIVFRILVFAIIAFIIFLTLNSFYLINENLRTDFLRGIFMLNGLTMLVIVIIAFIKLTKLPISELRKNNDMVLLLWITLPWIFLVLFAPFFATRHMILILPPLILLFIKPIRSFKQKTMAILSIVLTIGITTGLGISDWKYANFFRATAQTLKYTYPDTSIHSYTGHWGWQYYMKREGFNQYDMNAVQPEKSSLLFMPRGVNQQILNDSIKLVPYDTIIAPPTPYFSTARKAAFYDCSWKKLPWFISYEPFDTIFIKQVQ